MLRGGNQVLVERVKASLLASGVDEVEAAWTADRAAALFEASCGSGGGRGGGSGAAKVPSVGGGPPKRAQLTSPSSRPPKRVPPPARADDVSRWSTSTNVKPKADAGCVRAGCLRMPRGYSFLHVPKTGGTSIEERAPWLGLHVLTAPHTREFNQRLHAKVPGGGSIWHLPPDMFEAKFGVARSPDRLPLLCVVRNPADRLRSEVAWRCALDRSRNDTSCSRQARKAAEAAMVREADAVLRAERRGRKSLHHATDRMLHMLPQAWFVWAEGGRAQCDCVVAYNKLDRVAGLFHKNANSHTEVGRRLEPALACARHRSCRCLASTSYTPVAGRLAQQPRVPSPLRPRRGAVRQRERREGALLDAGARAPAVPMALRCVTIACE